MLHSTPSAMVQFLTHQNPPTLLSLHCKRKGPKEVAPHFADRFSESLNDEAEQEAKLFTEALKSYESEVPKKYKTGINLDQTHSIGDVVKQIDSALKEYKHNTQNPVWEAIRRGFWKLSETKDGLENWLELLPSSSDYSSLIFGGLNLIIQAAGRIGDVRNETFKALSEIPFHLSSTRESVGIFAKSEALRKCGVKLYTVTLEALGHILRWFKKRAIGL